MFAEPIWGKTIIQEAIKQFVDFPFFIIWLLHKLKTREITYYTHAYIARLEVKPRCSDWYLELFLSNQFDHDYCFSIDV